MTQPKNAETLSTRLQTHRRMRTAHGATLAELTLLEEVGEALKTAESDRDVAEKFHTVAIQQRDAAWRELERLREAQAERDAYRNLVAVLRAEAEAATGSHHNRLASADHVLRRIDSQLVTEGLPALATPAPQQAEVVYAERADYRDGDVTLVGAVRDEGVRLGMQAVEPWYGTGVLIPPGHPAHRPALTLIAALAQAQGGEVQP